MAIYDEKLKQELLKYIIKFDRDEEGGSKQIHDKSMRSELEKISGIREEILEAMDDIQKCMIPSTKRGDNRVKLKTYLCMCALQDKQIPYNPVAIANLVPCSNPNKKSKGKVMKDPNAKRKVSYLSKSISSFSAVQTGYEAPFIAYDPRYWIYIIGYVCHLTIEESRNIDAFATRILMKCPDLFQEAGIKLAAGMVHCYANVNGTNLGADVIGEAVGLSPATMSDIYNKVNQIYNLI